MHISNVAESQEEKPVINGVFVINLSKNQKDQYGSQFDEDKSEAPDIFGESPGQYHNIVVMDRYSSIRSTELFIHLLIHETQP